jgi:4-amino-4-deoxy-L-arabinose transferase-like glycosyltransferase
LKVVRTIFGSIFVLIGIAALVRFDELSRLFLFLSPDGVVEPFMMLMLRLALISMGVVGLVFVLYEKLIQLCLLIDVRISSLNRQTFLLIVLSVAFALRLGAILLMPFHLWDYFGVYDDLAAQWAVKGGYYDGDRLTAYWPPGYPFFLSRLYLLFGHLPAVGSIANVLWSVIIVWLAYLLARKVWDEPTARWTMVLMSFFPSQILFTRLLVSEMMFTALLLASLLLFFHGVNNERTNWSVVSIGGVLLGLATLTRAVAKYLPVIIILYFALQTRSFRTTVKLGVLALAGFAVVVTPWVVRNYYAVGSASINTNTGVNLYIGNQPGSGMGYRPNLVESPPTDDSATESSVDSAAWHQAWAYIFEDPWAFIRRGLMKLAYFYAVDMDALLHELIIVPETSVTNRYVSLAFLTESYYLLIIALAGLGIVARFCNPRQNCWGSHLLLATILYWSAVHFVFYGSGRYHFPIIPLLAGFAASFLSHTLRKRFRRTAAENTA